MPRNRPRMRSPAPGWTSWRRGDSEIGCVMDLTELGCTEDMLDELADATLVMEGGYHVLSREEIIEVLRAAL